MLRDLNGTVLSLARVLRERRRVVTLSGNIDWHTNTESIPRASEFGERLARCNALYGLGFEEWVFYPGMLFRALGTWWGNGGNRRRPHEGLDVCLYRTKDRKVHRFDEKTRIPVMYEGEVVKIGDDFLGRSVYISHSIYDSHGRQLLTIYGHTRPHDGIHPGRVLSEEDVLGAIADPGKRRGEIPPHIHISVAWVPRSLCYEKFDWETIGDPGIVALLNPLDVIACRYSILEDA